MIDRSSVLRTLTNLPSIALRLDQNSYNVCADDEDDADASFGYLSEFN